MYYNKATGISALFLGPESRLAILWTKSDHGHSSLAGMKIWHISKITYPESILVVVGASRTCTNNHNPSDFSDR